MIIEMSSGSAMLPRRRDGTIGSMFEQDRGSTSASDVRRDRVRCGGCTGKRDATEMAREMLIAGHDHDC